MAYNDYNNGYDPSGYNQPNYYDQSGYNPGSNGYNNYNAGYDNSYNGGYNGGYDASRYYASDSKIISSEMYNLIIGGVLLYGFLINCFMTAFFGDSIMMFVYTNPIAFYIGYFVLAIAGTFMIKKSDNPVVSFVGYNLMVVPIGMVLASVITLYGMVGYSGIVTTAFAITAVVTLIMMFVSSIFPTFFLSMGRTLGVTLLVTIVIELVLMLVGADLGIIDYIVVLIFCGYVGYDWAKANAIEKTVDNAVDSAAELYLDIVNLFLRILRILARASRN